MTHEHESPSRQDLIDAYYHGVRNNSLDGEDQTRGFSPEQAADLGFDTPEKMDRILSSLGGTASSSEAPAEIGENAKPTLHQRANEMAEKAAQDARLRGEQKAAEFMQNPDSFGADWPTTTMGKSTKPTKKAPGYKTEAQRNARKHEKEARKDRWGK